MSGRKRTVQIKFYVTEEERDLIAEKMKLIPSRKMAAYLRKIAMNGGFFFNNRGLDEGYFLCPINQTGFLIKNLERDKAFHFIIFIVNLLSC